MQFGSLISQGFDWKSRGEAWEPSNGEEGARERALVTHGKRMVEMTIGGDEREI
jgi:hypothetical protein